MALGVGRCLGDVLLGQGGELGEGLDYGAGGPAVLDGFQGLFAFCA